MVQLQVLVLVACFAVSFGIESWIEGGVIAAVILMLVSRANCKRVDA